LTDAVGSQPPPGAASARRPPRRSPGWILAAVLIGLGALLAVALGWATDYVACETEGTDACSRSGLAELQLWIAVAGLVPAGLTLGAAFRGTHNRLRWIAAVTVLIYLVWAVLNDAAVHGWGSDMRLVP
jgi:drug/metabolite transporter (DMT)-like permease